MFGDYFKALTRGLTAYRQRPFLTFSIAAEYQFVKVTGFEMESRPARGGFLVYSTRSEIILQIWLTSA